MKHISYSSSRDGDDRSHIWDVAMGAGPRTFSSVRILVSQSASLFFLLSSISLTHYTFFFCRAEVVFLLGAGAGAGAGVEPAALET